MSTITIIRGTCSGTDLKGVMTKIEASHAEVLGAAMVMKNTEQGWVTDYVVTARGLLLGAVA